MKWESCNARPEVIVFRFAGFTDLWKVGPEAFSREESWAWITNVHGSGFNASCHGRRRPLIRGPRDGPATRILA
jgi:hypothetical protein